ncbi:MAG: hypothetical protein AAFO95_21390 [Cyanobacteria bacterium J06600_6]
MGKNKALKIAESDKNCFSYDTEILVIVRGFMVKALPIGLIVERKLDCFIHSINRETGFVGTQKIEQWHDRGEQEVFEYALDDGTTIKATKDHKFMTSDGQMLPIEEIFERGLDLVCRNSYLIDGYDFRSIIPDYYTCPYTYGNTCGFGIVKLDTIYAVEHHGCTEGYRTSGDPKLDCQYNSKNFSLCFDNWMLSKNLYYDNYSDFVNICINGYRNETYIRQRQELDNSFTAEESTTPEHTYLALSTAIEQALKLEKFLQKSGKFSEDKLIDFSCYISSLNLPNYYRDCHVRNPNIEQVAVLKEIIDYIIANPSNINELVSQETIDEFERQYKTYQKDSERYKHETIEERRDRFNK